MVGWTLLLRHPPHGLPFATLGPHADVAQLVEHQLPKLRVAGSIPVVRFGATKPKPALLGGFWRLRGRAVRRLETA
jgi:hypothetical protein